jgi:hypothetical protein
MENEHLNYDEFQIDTSHVFNKMLFDSFNEILDTKRTFGI